MGYRRAPADDGPDELEAFTAALRTRDGSERFVAAGGWDEGRPRSAAPRIAPLPPAGDADYFPDDDEYVEFTVEWDDLTPVAEQVPAVPVASNEDGPTEPLDVPVEHPLHAPADTWHSGPVESWHSLLEPEPEPQLEPVAPQPVPATNGWVPTRSILDELLDDSPPATTPIPTPEPIGFTHNGFHVESEQYLQAPPPPQAPPPEPAPRGRHSRDDDAGTYGRHSMRFRD